MTHQVNLFLLLFGALQGFLVSLWLFRNQNKKLSHLYLTLFLVVVGLQLTLKVITKVWMMEYAMIPYALSYKLPYLIGPLLFLYAKALTENKWNQRDLLHFIPFLFFVAVSLLWTGPHFHAYTQAAFQFISLISYSFLAWRMANPFVRLFVLLVASAEVVIIITLALMHAYYPMFPDVRILFVVLTLLVYWISYQLLAKPELLIEQESPPAVSLALLKKNKYAHSSLKPAETLRIESAIRQVLINEKLFLDSSLTIDALAAKIQTSRHHLSQVFNEKLGKTYLEFLVDLRLTEAKARLSNPANHRYTIAAIALDSGFNSVSSFNDIFKKRFAVTPSQFRDSCLNQMIA